MALLDGAAVGAATSLGTPQVRHADEIGLLDGRKYGRGPLERGSLANRIPNRFFSTLRSNGQLEDLAA